jgi:hypothetical protein
VPEEFVGAIDEVNVLDRSAACVHRNCLDVAKKELIFGGTGSAVSVLAVGAWRELEQGGNREGLLWCLGLVARTPLCHLPAAPGERA